MPEATKTFLMPGSFRDGLHQLDQGAMVGAQQLADRRMDAAQPAAFGFDLGPAAAHLIHVGRRAADVADHALEVRDRPSSGGFRRSPTPGCGFG